MFLGPGGWARQAASSAAEAVAAPLGALTSASLTRGPAGPSDRAALWTGGGLQGAAPGRSRRSCQPRPGSSGPGLKAAAWWPWGTRRGVRAQRCQARFPPPRHPPGEGSWVQAGGPASSGGPCGVTCGARSRPQSPGDKSVATLPPLPAPPWETLGGPRPPQPGWSSCPQPCQAHPSEPGNPHPTPELSVGRLSCSWHTLG